MPSFLAMPKSHALPQFEACLQQHLFLQLQNLLASTSVVSLPFTSYPSSPQRQCFYDFVQLRSDKMMVYLALLLACRPSRGLQFSFSVTYAREQI